MTPFDTSDLQDKIGQELTRKRVLLVDRHPNARNSLRLMLSTLGVSAVHNAGNSAEALRQVKANRFDIILSDYVLDDERDGQQLLEEFRQQNLIPRVAVFIIITGERNHRNVISVAELSPDDYLIKPFTIDQLQNRLLKAIYKKQCFTRVFEHLDKSAFAEALHACDNLDGNFPYETLRLKGEILNALSKHKEAQEIYLQVIESRPAPWARMGLAIALRGQEQLAEAETLGQSIIEEFPDFMAAYDFVAGVREEMGKLIEAQDVLQQAASISPNNSIRQRMVGDLAARNNDLDVAEKAYSKVLERQRGSSLQNIDNYTNLARVMLDNGHAEGAKTVTQDLRRDWRGSKSGECAALIMESLCAEKEGDADKAKDTLEKALILHDALQSEPDKNSLSQKLTVDLAHACLANGDDAIAQKILRQVAAENHEDRSMIAHIQSVFAKTGNEQMGQALLTEVGKEIVDLNNRGVMAARSGDMAGAVQMLIAAAEHVPNLQFLVNASKAIFNLLDRQGWDETMAARALHYVHLAHSKYTNNRKVISANELYQRVAQKYGITPVPLSGADDEEEKLPGDQASSQA